MACSMRLLINPALIIGRAICGEGSWEPPYLIRVHSRAICTFTRNACAIGHGGVALLVIDADTTQAQSLELPISSERYTLSAQNLQDTHVRLNGIELQIGAEDAGPIKGTADPLRPSGLCAGKHYIFGHPERAQCETWPITCGGAQLLLGSSFAITL